MITNTPRARRAKCKECKSDVEIIIPSNRLGNIYGEVWKCPIHGENVKEIEYGIADLKS